MRLAFVFAAAIAALPPAAAQAATLFDATQTGAQLDANPNVGFPTGTHSVSGASLIFNTGGVNHAAIMLWDLLPAGARGDLTFQIDLAYSALTIDNDLIFGFVAGGKFLGLQRYDNSGGNLRGESADIVGNVIQNRVTQASGVLGGLGGASASQPISVTLTVDDAGAGAEIVSGTEAGEPGTLTYAYPAADVFDTDDAIQFGFFRASANGVSERYQIDSLRVQVEGDPSVVPLPASLWLLGAGALGLAGLRRRAG